MAGKRRRRDSYHPNSPPFSGSITSRRMSRGGSRSSLSASISHGGTSTSHDDQYETQTTHASESAVDEETDEEIEGSDSLEEEIVGSSGKDVATSAGQYGKEMVAELLKWNQMLTRRVAEQAAELEYLKEMAFNLCAHLKIPIPGQPPSTPEERRSAANEDQGGSRSGSS